MKEQTTKIKKWIETGDVGELYQEYLKQYGYLQEESYAHKREQLYLMLQQGASKNFICSFFEEDANITSRDLDVIRGIALLAGEDLVMDQFYKKELTLDQIKEKLGEHFAAKVVQRLPDAGKMLKEMEHMKERFELQMDFMQKERAHMQEHYQELKEKEIRIEQQAGEIEQIRLQNEIEKLKEKLQDLQTEQEELLKINAEQTEQLAQLGIQGGGQEGEKVRLLVKCGEMKKQIREELEEKELEEPSGNFFQMLQQYRESKKSKKEKEQRNKVILDTLSDPRFNAEQLDLIVQAAKSGLGLQELQQLCVPELSAANMKILAMFYLKQQGKEKEDE